MFPWSRASESGKRPQHVYFPTTYTVSLLYNMTNGTSLESAIVGNDGMISFLLLYHRGANPPGGWR